MPLKKLLVLFPILIPTPKSLPAGEIFVAGAFFLFTVLPFDMIFKVKTVL